MTVRPSSIGPELRIVGRVATEEIRRVAALTGRRPMDVVYAALRLGLPLVEHERTNEGNPR